jgi:hypothetical protein
MVQSVAHGKKLVQDSLARNPTKKMVYYARTMKPEARDQVEVEPHDLVVGTYNIFDTGLDVGYLDTLVFATPRRTITQAIGRLRSYSTFERKTSLILDVVDNFSIFKSQFMARRQVYKLKKFQVLNTVELTSDVQTLTTELGRPLVSVSGPASSCSSGFSSSSSCAGYKLKTKPKRKQPQEQGEGEEEEEARESKRPRQ